MNRRTDRVETIVRVPLPFVVETHIALRIALRWRDSSASVAYIDLNAYMETKAAEGDTDECEIFLDLNG